MSRVNILSYFGVSGRGSPLVEPLPDVGAFWAFADGTTLDWHEICVTLKPKWFDKCAVQMRTLFYEWVRAWYMKHLKYRPHIVCYPEFNKAGIVHWHLMMYVENGNDAWAAEFKRLAGNKWGRTQGKAVFNMSNYKKYMQKDAGKCGAPWYFSALAWAVPRPMIAGVNPQTLNRRLL